MTRYTSRVRSEVPSQVTAYESYQTTKQTYVKGVLNKFLIFLKANMKYVPKSWSTTSYNWAKNKYDNPPTYIVSNTTSQYFHVTWRGDCPGSCWWNLWGWKVGCRTCTKGYTEYYWDINLNTNFDTEIADAVNTINSYTTQMNVYMFNDCSNTNTLLNTQGLQKCNYETTVNNSYSLAQEKKQISENTMNLLQNSDDYPQYEGAKNMDQELTADANWKFTDKINSDWPNYNYQYKNLQNLIQTRTNFLNQSYNNCQYPQSSLTSIDNNGVPIPSCVSNPYNTAINQCEQAYKMAQKYQYGSDQIKGLWIDVSNAIPGNTIKASGTILDNANISCQKWVEMFNMWQEKEDAALAAPCIPERPITTQSDTTIEKLVDNFSNNSSDRINAVKQRANNLIEKMKYYPNILELNKENITTAPYGMTPSVSIKNKGEFGDIPIQYLEMILPKGQPGIMGATGIVGMKGLPGKPGPVGEEGPVGNPILPF